MTKKRVASILSKWGLIISWSISIVAVLGSLYFSEVAG
ncbi:hypothetical protein EDD64_1601, partial [Effusibacillus lacus]